MVGFCLTASAGPKVSCFGLRVPDAVAGDRAALHLGGWQDRTIRILLLRLLLFARFGCLLHPADFQDAEARNLGVSLYGHHTRNRPSAPVRDERSPDALTYAADCPRATSGRMDQPQTSLPPDCARRVLSAWLDTTRTVTTAPLPAAGCT